MNWYTISQKKIEEIPQGIQGHCFQNVHRNPSLHDENTLAVHGKVRNSGTDKIFDHAWIEKENTVIDPTLGKIFDKELYYQLFNASPEAKYSYIQIIKNMIKTKNHGPWTLQEVGNNFTWRKDS